MRRSLLPSLMCAPAVGRWPLRLGGLALVLAATGCNTLSRVPDVELAKGPDDPSMLYPARQERSFDPPTGSLFATSSYRPGFEDHRARLVGDALTINVVESVLASQESNSGVSRQSTLGAAISMLPLIGTALGTKLDAEAETSNSMSGNGSTASNNFFQGAITATVVEVLPNGHLQVVAEKQVGVNQNVDVLKFTGTVDPRTIAPGNMVASTQVANVRVLSRGRGAQDDAQTFGWLARFFLTLSPF